MRWSKLRSLVLEGVVESLRGRLDINNTRYGHDMGHVWLTLDGAVIANFCASAAAIKMSEPSWIPRNTMYKRQLLEFGEMSRADACAACWTFIHDLSIEEALSNPDPLIQSLAVIDHRLGKRRLRRIRPEQLHPLAAKLLEVRIEAECLKQHSDDLNIAEAVKA